MLSQSGGIFPPDLGERDRHQPAVTREEQARRVEMDRLKDLFLGALGHDLRNPLNTILTAAQLLQRMNPGERQERHLGTIERTVKRMNAMVEDILDLTAGKFVGKVPLTIEPADLASTCHGVIDEIRSRHGDRSVHVEITGDVTGEWDVIRLGRVVGNLVANAMQHGQGEVRVHLVGEEERVSIEVHNEGPAIRPDLVPLLFEPFRRGDTSPNGYGLGLYIVREVARAHGGEATVHSSDAGGTTFVVTVPRKPPPVESAEGV